MTFTVKLLKKEKLTHDVLAISLERPADYRFTPGQYAYLTMDGPDRPAEQVPFSFVGLNGDPELHLVVKSSPANPSANAHLQRLKEGDMVQISGPRNEVAYQGPGVFIAGGTGIAPFMAIFRQLHADGMLAGNMLLYANKRGEDICFEGELRMLLGNDFISILALENKPRNAVGEMDAGFIHRHVKSLDQPFHVCGPEPFVNSVADALHELGVKEGRIMLYAWDTLPESAMDAGRR